MKPIRIDLESEPGKFINVLVPHHSTGYAKIDRCQERIGDGEVLCSIRFKVEDIPSTFVEIMLRCGITPGEILAQVFGQIHNEDPEIIEMLMRR